MDLESKIKNLVQSYDNIECAAIVTNDGLPLASEGLSSETTDVLGAMAGAMSSFSNRVSGELNGSRVETVRIDFSGHLMWVFPANEVVLAVAIIKGTNTQEVLQKVIEQFREWYPEVSETKQ